MVLNQNQQLNTNSEQIPPVGKVEEMRQIEIDPNFQALPEQSQLEIRRMYEPEFASLNPQDQLNTHQQIMGQIELNQMPVGEVAQRGFQRGALNLGANAIQGINAGVQGIADTFNPSKVAGVVPTIAAAPFGQAENVGKIFYDKNSAFNKVWDFIPSHIDKGLSSISDSMNKKAQAQELIAPTNATFNGIKNLGDVGRFSINSMSEQIPQQIGNVAAMVATKGKALMPYLATTEAGSQYQDMKNNGVKDGVAAWRYGVGAAKLEGAFDPIIRAFKSVPGKRLAKELANPTMVSGIKGNIAKIIKEMGKGATLEPTEEVLQQIYSNLVKKSTGIKVSAFDGVPESFAASIPSGMLFGGGGHVIKTVRGKSNIHNQVDETLSEMDKERAELRAKTHNLKEELGAYQQVINQNSGIVPKTYDNKANDKYKKGYSKLTKELQAAEKRLADIENMGNDITAKYLAIPKKQVKQSPVIEKLNHTEPAKDDAIQLPKDEKGRYVLRSSKGTAPRNEIHAKNIAKVHNISGNIEKVGNDYVIKADEKGNGPTALDKKANEAGQKILQTAAEKFEPGKARRDALKQGFNPRHVEFDDKSQEWVINPERTSPDENPKRTAHFQEKREEKEAIQQANLSDEQKLKLAESKANYDKNIERIKTRDYSKTTEGVTVSDEEQRQAHLKGEGMKYAAEKRKIIQGESLEPVSGGLTAKELDNKVKYLSSNYMGKKVSVEGVNGTVSGTAFGKVMVALADGSVKTVEKTEIKEPMVQSGYEILPKDQKELKDDLFRILSEITKKDRAYLKMILGAESENMPIQKRQEAIQNLVDSVEDIATTENLYSKYEDVLAKVGISWQGQRDEIGGDAEFANKIIEAIEQKKWQKPSDVENILQEYEQQYGEYLEQQEKENQQKYDEASVTTIRHFYEQLSDKEDITQGTLENAYKSAFNVIINKDSDMDSETLSKIIKDLDNVFNEETEYVKSKRQQSEITQRPSVQDEGAITDKQTTGEVSKDKKGGGQIDGPESTVKQSEISTENKEENPPATEDLKFSEDKLIKALSEDVYIGKSGSRQLRYDVEKIPTVFADGKTVEPSIKNKEHYETIQKAIIENKTLDFKVDPSEPTIDGYDRNFSPKGFTVSKKGDVIVFGSRLNHETGIVESKGYNLNTILDVDMTNLRGYPAPAITLKDGAKVVYGNSYKAHVLEKVSDSIHKSTGLTKDQFRDVRNWTPETFAKVQESMRKNKELWKELARLNPCYG